MDKVLVDDVRPVDLRIHRRNLVQGVIAGLGEEGHEAEFHAVLLQELVFVFVPKVHDRAHVHLIIRGQHGGGVLRVLQAARDGLAQARHPHPFLPRRVFGGDGRTGRLGRGGGWRGSRGDWGGLRLDAARGFRQYVGFRFAAAGGLGGGGRLRLFLFLRRFLSFGGGGGRGAGAQRSEDGVEADGLSFLGDDLVDRSRGGSGHFDRDLVGFQLADRLIRRDAVAGLLEPLGDSRLCDAFAKRWHLDFNIGAGFGAFVFGHGRVLLPGGRGCGGAVSGFKQGEQGVEADGLAFLGDDFGDRPGGWRRNLDRNLVGLQLTKRRLGGHGLAGLDQPLGDGRLGDAFAQRRYANFD